MLKRTALALGLICSLSAQAEMVEDLSQWQPEGTSGTWSYDASTNSWFQSENTPTASFLYDPSGSALDKAIAGEITVTGGDDDWIGFAVGYNAGDVTSENADYFLMTWKRNAQSGMDRGLDMWHVTGSLDAGGLWSPLSHPSMRHVANANTLFDTGWSPNVDYSFDITYESHSIGVFVNDTLEFGLTRSGAGVSEFSEGGFAFFNFSQGGVNYGGVQYDQIDAVVSEEKRAELANNVPVSGGAAAILIAGMAALRRKK